MAFTHVFGLLHGYFRVDLKKELLNPSVLQEKNYIILERGNG